MEQNLSLTAPLEFGAEVVPESVGMTRDGVRRIVGVFEEQLARGMHPGSQLVVLRRGRVVVDRAGGLADLRRGSRSDGRALPVTPDTPFLTWSCSKAFTGMCVHRLIDEGRVALDAPVAEYWPEFGCKGKEAATIRHVFLHQAGVPTRGLLAQVFLWHDWERVTTSVANLRAEWPPGSKTAYHLVNYGFILGEVVRRVTGQPIQEYMAQTFFGPLGMQNSWLGLPESQRERVAGLYAEPEQQLAVRVFRNWRVRSAVIPAATLHSTARDMATFYQMLLNGGQYAGHRFVRPETVAAATALGYEGYDAHLRFHMRWAYGFHLGGQIPANRAHVNAMGKGSTIRTFGHFGQASCMAWADPDAGLVVVFLCNRLLNMFAVPRRFQEISDAVWDAIG